MTNCSINSKQVYKSSKKCAVSWYPEELRKQCIARLAIIVANAFGDISIYYCLRDYATWLKVPLILNNGLGFDTRSTYLR